MAFVIGIKNNLYFYQWPDGPLGHKKNGGARLVSLSRIFNCNVFTSVS